MQPKIILIRHTRIEGKQVMGDLLVYLGQSTIYKCATIERDWQNNERQESCIPAGKYKAVYEHSPAFNMNLYELKGVPGRSEIKIHVANYFSQLNGCIAVGQGYAMINKDGVPDLTSSGVTLNKLHNALYPHKEITITIVDAW